MPRDLQSLDILLVHGAWHSSWYWEEKVAPWLRDQGATVNCIDLPGHGGSGSARIGFHSINDYVDAVALRLQQNERPMVVVGHSMGGHVVQKLMERRPSKLAGAALLASVPPDGVWRVVLSLLRKHPIDLLRTTVGMDLYRIVRTPALARELFYSPALSQDVLMGYWQRVQNESFRAFLDMLILNLPRPDRVDRDLPKWVAGGQADVVFPPSSIEATAEAYGVEATIYASMAHSSLLLEDGWQQVASDLLDWIKAIE